MNSESFLPEWVGAQAWWSKLAMKCLEASSPIHDVAQMSIRPVHLLRLHSQDALDRFEFLTFGEPWNRHSLALRLSGHPLPLPEYWRVWRLSALNPKRHSGS